MVGYRLRLHLNLWKLRNKRPKVLELRREKDDDGRLKAGRSVKILEKVEGGNLLSRILTCSIKPQTGRDTNVVGYRIST